MKSIVNLWLSGIAVFAFSSGCGARDFVAVPISPELAETVLIQGNNQFAIDLYKEVCEGAEEDNVFFSPFSISSALGMTYSGAEGETASEMADVLHFSLPVSLISSSFKAITESLSSGSLNGANSGEPFTLAISSGLWVDNNFQLLDSFVEDMSRYYDAAVENVDFTGDPEGARERINSWVAEKTNDKIMNLIPEGSIVADTRTVLTNAVYFKASWSNPFDADFTREEPFTLADQSISTVPMMRQEEHFNIAISEQWSAIEMHYSGGDASMLIILPSGDLQELESAFDLDMLAEIRGSLSSRNVNISMPVFEFTRSMSLSDVLRSLGMELAFGMRADFSGFTGNRDLYISDVVHKAFVKVDEEGTEAAAATAVVMNMLSMPETPVKMEINKPFMFLVQDNTTGSIVFMGRVMNPAL